MRRYIAIFLVLVALLSCVTVTAAADVSTGGILDPAPYTFDSEYELSYEDAPLYGTGSYPGGNFDMTKNVGDSKPTYTYISAGSSDREFWLVLTTPTWSNYDFIDVQVHMDVSHITSVSAALGDLSIPIVTSYISSSAFDGQDYYLTIRMDLRGIEFTAAADPVVTVCGMTSWEYQSYISLTACSGVRIVNDPNLSFFEILLDAVHDFHTNMANWFDLQIASMGKWFNDLESSFDASIQKVVDAINGDQTAGEEFGSAVETQASKLEEMGQVFDSVERPEVENVQMSVDAYLSPADLHSATAGLSAAISSGPLLSVFMMALIMATVGYILYGKR